jgi:hypothetical protein
MELFKFTTILSPGAFRISLIISIIVGHSFMHKHKLIELQKIVDEKIGSLKEEVEIAPNMRLIPLYIAERYQLNGSFRQY